MSRNYAAFTPEQKEGCFLDYVALGSRRSLRILAAKYAKETKEKGTRRPLFTTLSDWSKHGNWQARVAELDKQFYPEQSDDRQVIIAPRKLDGLDTPEGTKRTKLLLRRSADILLERLIARNEVSDLSRNRNDSLRDFDDMKTAVTAIEAASKIEGGVMDVVDRLEGQKVDECYLEALTLVEEVSKRAAQALVERSELKHKENKASAAVKEMMYAN